jgi:lysophospholipase L1-like esterase
MFRIASLALALALGALTPAFAADPAPAGGRFAAEIDAFAAADQASPPPACPLLFTGASTIRLWSTLAHDLAPYPVLNRGFGGAQIADVTANFDRVIARYRPRAIVLYAGGDDLDAGDTPDEVVADFKTFMALKRKAFKSVRVYFVSVKPSKARIAEYPAQEAVNQAVKAMTLTQHDLIFVDVVPDMMADGKPKDIFEGDGLHLTPAGYAIWTKDIRRVLGWTGAQKLKCPAPEKVRKAK